MNPPMKELKEDEMNIKQEITDEIFIVGSNQNKEKKLPANIKCPKHPDKFITTICTYTDCTFQRTFCPDCLNYEVIQNQLQHFNPHQKYMKSLRDFFSENLEILHWKRSPDFKEKIEQVNEKIAQLKLNIDNEEIKKKGKIEISYLTNSIFGLNEKIEQIHRNLYGQILKKKVFNKIKQTKKKKNTKELEKKIKRIKALVANYLNNFLNKSKDVGFIDKVDRVIDFIKLKHFKKIETEMHMIREEIIEIEEEDKGKNNEKFDLSEEEKIIVKSLKKIKIAVENYRNTSENALEINENEEKNIKLEKPIF